MTSPIRYMGFTDVAARLGITTGSLANTPLPPPDALTGTTRGWLPGTIEAWNSTRPGKGGRKPAKAPGGMLTITQAANTLGISRQGVFSRIKAGTLSAEKIGNIWAIPAVALESGQRGRQ